MKEGKSAVKNSPGKENEPDTENTTKKKTKEEKPPLKVVVRRLPPSMTEEQFKMQVSPMPDYDYFYFVQADMTLMPNAFTRAYINFVDQNDLFIFTEKFDGYVFIDSKGFEFPAVVEFAPFQRIPKNRPSRKKDSKVGTIESDPTYIAFKELLEAENLENKTAANVSKQHFFETALAQEKKDEVSNTPLLDYIKNKRAERQRIRDEKREEKRKKDLERRKAKEEQRKVKKDDETSVVKNPSPTPANPIPKTKEVSLDNMEKRGNLSNNKLEKKISSNETIFITHTTALSKVKNEEKVLTSSQTVNKEKPKDKEVKPSFVKKKPEEGKSTAKEKVTAETKFKEGKRTGKIHLEERQRLAEHREERKKQSHSQSNNSTTNTSVTKDEGRSSVAGEDETSEDIASPVTESRGKETDHKKSERVYKREERRGSYKYDKYDSKRDRDDDSRRIRRGSERSYQSSKREDDRSEDGGRRRYSESRRGYDSAQRERYKEKEKNKTYNQKKSESVTEVDKKTKPEKEGLSNPLNENAEERDLENVNKAGNGNIKKSGPNADHVKTLDKENSEKLDVGSKKKSFDSSKPIRRKSMDHEQTKSSLSNTKYNSKDNYSDKKRRNSMGSSKHSAENEGKFIHQNKEEEPVIKNDTNTTSVSKLTKQDESSIEEQAKYSEGKTKSTEDGELNKELGEEQRKMPKRRNSTGGQELEVISPRRNSLGSENINTVVTFKEQNGDSELAFEEEKSKDENKRTQNSRDPRTDRKIRNKDRPSLEIYRPGMGRFSKQRFGKEKEKEKGLGSSTEVDSPSPSPSPTPQLKHKSTTSNQ